jgi:hypothetical protein
MHKQERVFDSLTAYTPPREYDNPLLWPILTLLNQHPHGWKVHTLAGELNDQQVIPVLDESPERDLFRRNFLIMNALYQLQEMLLPDSWLQVESMDIQLNSVASREVDWQVDRSDPLRSYYTDWDNYDVSDAEVKVLLNDFWNRFCYTNVGQQALPLQREQALMLFELPLDASAVMIRKTWRQLALRWHPDRPNGDSDRFRQLCEAWNVLRKVESFE